MRKKGRGKNNKKKCPRLKRKKKELWVLYSYIIFSFWREIFGIVFQQHKDSKKNFRLEQVGRDIHIA